MDKLELKEILIAQKRELKIISSDNIIERDILQSSKKYVDTDFIKVVLGVRRCGKSVFSLQLFKGRLFAYINFDDERLFRITADDLNNVLEVLHEIYGNFKYLFLDEIQNIERWELFVNRCRRQGYNIIITGSNSTLLSRELATHLTGRYIELELYPFSFNEFLRYHKLEYNNEDLYLPDKIGKIKNMMQEFINSGGMPETLIYKDVKKKYLADLYNAIIGKDIITRYNIRHSKTLKDIATYIISNHSNEISYNKLKNMFNSKSVHTVENYVSYIEKAYLIFQLYSFSFKVKLQRMAPKKMYVIDTGFANVLSTKHFDTTSRLMENVVAIEFLRRKSRDQTEIFYYKSKYQEEVDFVVKNGLKIKQLAQVCYSVSEEKTKEREVKALLKASNELKCKNLLVITWDYEAVEKHKGKTIKFMPLWKWLLS